MKGSARWRSPESRMNACCSSPATRPTSNIRSPRFIRSRSIAATSIPSPKRKVPVVAVLGGARDRLAELLAGVVLDRQHAVDVTAETQRPDHVVRRSDQVVPAQRLEPLVLLAGHPCGLIQVGEPGPVELADDPGAAELLLVGVD